jgi:ABC-type glycerol-3-phosphate transport system substrate-binding protein
MKRRDFLKLAGSATALGALAACQAPTPVPAPKALPTPTSVPRLKVRFASWMPAEGWGIPAFKELKATYEARYPQYELEAVVIPAESMNQQLTMMATAGNAVDVAHVVRRWGPQLAATGALEDLTPHLTDKLKADLYPWMLTGGRYNNGKTDFGLVTVPFSPGPFLLCTNLKCLEAAGLPAQPPTTWQELQAAATKVGAYVGDKTLYGWGHWLTQSGTAAMWALDMIWAMGGHVQKADGSPEINGIENVNCWKAVKAWYDSSKNAWTKGIDVVQWRELFGRDQVAFVIEGPWMQGVMREVSGLGKAFDSHWVQTKVPVGATGGSTALESSTSVCMFKQSKVKAGAAALINLMSGDAEWQKKYYGYSGEVSPLMSMAKDATWYPERKAIFEQLPTARPEPVIERFDSAMEILSIAQLKILDGADVTTTLNVYQEQIARAWK